MERRDALKSFLAAPALLPAAVEASRRGMPPVKITDVQVILTQPDGNHAVIVKVLTSEPGLYGLGCATHRERALAVATAIEQYMKPFVVGRNVDDIEDIWQSAYVQSYFRSGVTLNNALSGIDGALWDILGQALGVPIYKLLGGAARRRIRMYKDVGSTPEDFLKAKAEGYTAAKAGFIRVDNDLVAPPLAVREGIRSLEVVRKAVGDDFDIGIDAHGILTTVMAIEFCTGIEHLRPLFVEEATQLEDLGELELLRRATKVPLATGERSFTKYGFTEYCSRHLVNYIQPDVVHAGGILEMKKIGAIAEAFRVEMAPHNPQSMVSTMASIHVDATTPACTIQEYSPRQEQWVQDLFYGEGAVVKNGYAELPDGPGLGVRLNEEVAAKHPYRPVNRPNYVFADGGVGDH